MKLLAILVAASLAGCCPLCPEHCSPAYCQGKMLQTCHLEGNDAGRVAVWSGTPCSGACVTDKTNGAFCAESATPIPECQKDGPACYQGAIGTCHAGYVQSSMACASGTTCAPGGSCGPICALATTTDARCPAPTGSDQTSSYCDGNIQVDCQCGYAVARVDCGTNFCIAIGGKSECALSSMTDPRCGSPTLPAAAFCDNNTLYSCWNGYVVFTQSCGATGTCFADPNGGVGGSGCSYKAM